MAEAWLYDGRTAVRQQASVEEEGGSLAVRLESTGETLSVPADTLCYVESRRGFDVYGRTDVEGWRLGLRSDDASALQRLLPGRQRYGRLIDRVGLWPAAVAALLISGTVIFAGGRLPAWIAPHVPFSWEKKMGDYLVGDFGGHYCTGRGGDAALKALAAKLSTDPSRLSIRVVPVQITNAVALPGGRIVVFEKILKDAASPDEFAGILAHEIAHVEKRHSTEAMIRQFGFGIVIAALGGGTGGNLEGLLSARYSRSAEAAADDQAIARLRQAGISPVPTSQFFARLGGDEKRLGRAATPLSYLASHPLSASREAKFRGSAVAGRAYRPALSPAEWNAVRNICTTDPRLPEKKIDPFSL